MNRVANKLIKGLNVPKLLFYKNIKDDCRKLLVFEKINKKPIAEIFDEISTEFLYTSGVILRPPKTEILPLISIKVLIGSWFWEMELFHEYVSCHRSKPQFFLNLAQIQSVEPNRISGDLSTI